MRGEIGLIYEVERNYKYNTPWSNLIIGFRDKESNLL